VTRPRPLTWHELEREVAREAVQRCNAAFWTEARKCALELGNKPLAAHYRNVADGARQRAAKIRAAIMRRGIAR